MKRKRKKKRLVEGGIGMAVLVKLLISLLLIGIGARWNGVVAGIDLQSHLGRSQALKDRLMNNIELITATEFGSNGKMGLARNALT